MPEHRLELADVFRTHQHDFLARWNSVLSRQQRKALRDIRDCRTAVLGGHLYECDRCGHRVKVFNSCRNRSCPKCQATARAKWLADREAELLPVPYFHVTFTLPQQIGRLALQNPRQIYTILFQAASETLLTIAADPSSPWQKPLFRGTPRQPGIALASGNSCEPNRPNQSENARHASESADRSKRRDRTPVQTPLGLPWLAPTA